MNSEYYLKVGVNNLGAKKFEDAIASFSNSIKLKEDYAEAYFYRGTAFGALSKYNEAEADFTKSLELNPDMIASYYYRAVTYERLNDVDRAIADYDTLISKMIAIEPDEEKLREKNDTGILVEAYNNRGALWGNRKDTEKAMADFSSALRIHPGHKSAYHNRAVVYANLKRYEEAIMDFTYLLRLEETIETLNNRAAMFMSIGKYREALLDFEKALKYDSENKFALDGKAQAQRKMW